MSTEEPKQPKKKKRRVKSVDTRTWRLRKIRSQNRYDVWHRSIWIGSIEKDIEDKARWRFAVGGKTLFRTYKSPKAALVALRALVRQRKRQRVKKDRAKEATK